MCAAVAVHTVPAMVVQLVAFAPGIGEVPLFRRTAFLTTPCGILPFGLGWQTEAASGHLAEPHGELLRLVPRDALHGQVVALELGRILAHHSFPHCLSNLIAANEIAVERDAVFGASQSIGELHALGGGIAAHGEAAAFHPHHLHLHALGHEHTDNAVLGAECYRPYKSQEPYKSYKPLYHSP